MALDPAGALESQWLRQRTRRAGPAKVYDGCQTWETAFIIQAFCSTDLVDEFSSTLEKAYGFLKNSQVLHDLPNGKSFYRHRSKGSWTLSTADNGWSVPDCTAEALQVIEGSVVFLEFSVLCTTCFCYRSKVN
ncbi:hypothetical protein GUJ93_ZPchr0011g27821 [Zizania palustris]|uniref:Uncharacterized protein n=1 Tax=Zizania palustris TaxID=103762 RepID=A0A8J5WHW8_ZIZPA|nr:hypothetical protein GUJ93_ZPchr0011g27821 [Zizania palustris]